MAKRRRLEPARIDDLPGRAPASPARAAMFPDLPASAPATRAPIADVAGDAAASAALTELAEGMAAARREGRLVLRLPLDAVDADYLVRDRLAVGEEEMEALCESLRQRGQQTPIEVTETGTGPDGAPRYGLISGWRRLTALRRLRDAGGAGFDTVLAISRQRADAAEAYLAMVEENEIRVGLSYYERARIVARAADRGVYPSDRAALSALFHAASRPRRSKIGSFLRIVRALDDHLRFPAALAERAGLALSAALDADQALEQRLIDALKDSVPQDAASEGRVIADVIAGPAKPRPAPREEVLAEGLTLVTRGDGGRQLTGPLLSDPGFLTRLKDWLARAST